MKRKLDVRPSPADHPLRRTCRLVMGTQHPLPPSAAWLSGWFPGIRDQGQEGSCTGHGTAGFREVLHGSATKQRLPYRLSPAFLYAKTRQAEGTFPADSGCTVADAIGVLHSFGTCREELFPYRADPEAVPGQGAELDAGRFRVGPPLNVATSELALKTVLAAGMPVVVGMPVGRSFMDVGPDGKVPRPPAGETPEGGHCVFLVGFNGWGLMGVNSWGTSWGDRGFMYFPWGYERLFWECWTAPLVD